MNTKQTTPKKETTTQSKAQSAKDQKPQTKIKEVIQDKDIMTVPKYKLTPEQRKLRREKEKEIKRKEAIEAQKEINNRTKEITTSNDNNIILIEKVKFKHYTKEQENEIFNNIIQLMLKGHSVLYGLKLYGINPVVFYRFVQNDINKSNEYAYAQEMRQNLLFDEIQHISDTEHDPNKARVRIDARKWILGRMNPAKYGDKNINIVTNNNTLNIEPGERDNKIELLLNKINSKDLLND